MKDSYTHLSLFLLTIPVVLFSILRKLTVFSYTHFIFYHVWWDKGDVTLAFIIPYNS